MASNLGKTPPDGTPATGPFLDASKVDLTGWHPHLVHDPRPEAGTWGHFSLWLPGGTQYGPEASVIGLEMYETASAPDAQAMAIRLANSCEIPGLRREATIADLAYVGDTGLPVIFASGPFAVVVSQAERGSIPALDVARAVATYLASTQNSPS
jgi:hypothetical protein